jgi:hypothetical protein
MKVMRLAALFVLSLVASHMAVAVQPVDVSMIQLIATPEKYQGERVRVLAFLRLEFEGDAVYLHQQDYEQAIYRNGLWIDLPKTTASGKNLSNQYVLVEGVFDAKRKRSSGFMVWHDQ